MLTVMEWFKIIVGTLAVMWGTEKECKGYMDALTDMGGECKMERCTQSDIKSICHRMW